MIFIGSIVLLLLCGLYALIYNSCKLKARFWDNLYEAGFVIVPLSILLVFFEFLLTLMYFENIDNHVNQTYSEVYALEQHLNEPMIFGIAQDKINEYNNLIEEKLFYGKVTGWDKTKWEQKPILDIDYNNNTLTIVERQR